MIGKSYIGKTAGGSNIWELKFQFHNVRSGVIFVQRYNFSDDNTYSSKEKAEFFIDHFHVLRERYGMEGDGNK